MKTWRQALEPIRCGYEWSHLIVRGERYLELEEGGRRRIRCAKCAVRYETQSATDETRHPVIEPEPVLDPETDPEPARESEGDPW